MTAPKQKKFASPLTTDRNNIDKNETIFERTI